jgi:opacity protein-like surface antigen
MGKRILILISFIYFSNSAWAQHHELSENFAEAGVMYGMASYQGDISPDVQVYYRSYGAFVKKQLNNYVGIRLNVEMQKLAAHDMLSSDPYAIARNANFLINTLDLSAMGEFYFLNYISGSRNKKFTPYVGMGVGYLLTLETIRNNNTSVVPADNATTKSDLPLTFPINFGLKYNIYRQFNLFGEAMYRFTNTDNLDFLNTNSTAPTFDAPLGYQGSRSGNDRFFSAKIGISYTFNTIYGIEQNKGQQNRSLLNRIRRK